MRQILVKETVWTDQIGRRVASKDRPKKGKKATSFFYFQLEVKKRFKVLWRLPGRTATKILFMYSFSGNCAASDPFSTFMCLWAIYIVPGSVTYFLQQNRQTNRGNIYIAHRHMNVEIGTETPIFLFWEYLFRNLCILCW